MIHQWASTISALVTSIASVGATVGVWFAYKQLKTSKEIAQLQFEDGLAKEYRELSSKIPTRALLGQQLSDEEYLQAFDELFRYIDLSNEQINLRCRNRIGEYVWNEWSRGIEANLKLPDFKRAWSEIQEQCSFFKELRRLESEAFRHDPVSWKHTNLRQPQTPICGSDDISLH